MIDVHIPIRPHTINPKHSSAYLSFACNQTVYRETLFVRALQKGCIAVNVRREGRGRGRKKGVPLASTYVT